MKEAESVRARANAVQKSIYDKIVTEWKDRENEQLERLKQAPKLSEELWPKVILKIYKAADDARYFTTYVLYSHLTSGHDDLWLEAGKLLTERLKKEGFNAWLNTSSYSEKTGRYGTPQDVYNASIDIDW